MADPAKSDDIEDVLSSIRRLVSEHQPIQRPAPTPTPSSAEAPPSPEREATDKLILTQALRVTDPEDPWRTISPRTSAESDDTVVAEDVAADEQTEPTQAIDQVGSVDPEVEAAEEGDDASTDWTQELWGEGPSSVADADPQLMADQWDEGDLPLPAESPEDEGNSIDAPLDVTEAALSSPDEDDGLPPLSFIRSTSSVSAYDPEDGDEVFGEDELPSATLDLASARGARPEEASPDDAGAPRVKVQILRPVPDVPQSQAEESDETDHAPSFAEAGRGSAVEDVDPLAALESVVTEFGAAAEPSDAPEADLADETAAAHDDADTFEDLGADSPFTFPDESDGFVDEEALREIIAEVVREELQGEMGVRITRNIRKLVRREIRLALSAQDLD